MKKYFYANGQEKEGPLTLEELKEREIYANTLIWHEGLEDWKEANTIDELKEILELIPPPIEKVEELFSKQNISYENQKKKDVRAQSSNMSRRGMFSNIFSFDGRIRRTEYGITVIFFSLSWTILNQILKSGDYPILALAYIPLLWIIWAQGAKRCHDLGVNGWWQIVPFYPIVLIFRDGDAFANKYGLSPKR